MTSSQGSTTGTQQHQTHGDASGSDSQPQKPTSGTSPDETMNQRTMGEVDPKVRALLHLQKRFYDVGLMRHLVNEEHAHRLGDAAAAASYDNLHMSGQCSENWWAKRDAECESTSGEAEGGDEEMGSFKFDSPTTVNHNYPTQPAPPSEEPSPQKSDEKKRSLLLPAALIAGSIAFGAPLAGYLNRAKETVLKTGVTDILGGRDLDAEVKEKPEE